MIKSAVNGDFLPTVHVEVSLKESSTASHSAVASRVREYLSTSTQILSSDFAEVNAFRDDPFLSMHAESVCAYCESVSFGKTLEIPLSKASIETYVYELDRHGSTYENMSEDTETSTPAAVHWVLPSAELHRQWENLIFDDDVKSKLVNFVFTAVRFSDKGIDPNKISWNRVVLLHGPPGTGKTSLCRALAHKLSIRLGSRYSYGQLVEINSHSLFSKWFSESGKLVHQMFEKIREMVEDSDALVCVLIDEVESLATARVSGGNEPGDALRVVNAMLTALDGIKAYPNVVVFTTSNITGSIDNAFVDRADIKHYIGLPSTHAVYQILQISIEELMNKGIIEMQVKCLSLSLYKVYQNDASKRLMKISESCQGLSGRTLKKLPFLAAASLYRSTTGLLKLNDFLDTLSTVIDEQHIEKKNLTRC